MFVNFCCGLRRSCSQDCSRIPLRVCCSPFNGADFLPGSVSWRQRAAAVHREPRAGYRRRARLLLSCPFQRRCACDCWGSEEMSRVAFKTTALLTIADDFKCYWFHLNCKLLVSTERVIFGNALNTASCRSALSFCLFVWGKTWFQCLSSLSSLFLFISWQNCFPPKSALSGAVNRFAVQSKLSLSVNISTTIQNTYL